MAGLDESLAWLAANSLGGGVGGDQFGVLGFELFHFVDELVEFGVADLGIVENIVAVLVVADLVAHGFDLRLDCGWRPVGGNYSARLDSSQFPVLSSQCCGKRIDICSKLAIELLVNKDSRGYLRTDLLLLRFPNSSSHGCAPSHARRRLAT